MCTTIELLSSVQGTFADPWIIPLIQGYVEVREVSVLTGQTSDVAQGRYHDHSNGATFKKKDSDLDLKVKAGGGAGGSGGEVRAMIEMTEMTSSKADDDEEEEDLKGTYMPRASAVSKIIHVLREGRDE